MMPEESLARRRPDGVALIARAHWLTGSVILSCVFLLYVMLRNSKVFAVSPDAYLSTLGLGLLYAATGFMVWTGAPTGRFFSYVCSLLYLARPQLGLPIWRIMSSPEYKAHFERPPRTSRPR